MRRMPGILKGIMPLRRGFRGKRPLTASPKTYTNKKESFD